MCVCACCMYFAFRLDKVRAAATHNMLVAVLSTQFGCGGAVRRCVCAGSSSSSSSRQWFKQQQAGGAWCVHEPTLCSLHAGPHRVSIQPTPGTAAEGGEEQVSQLRSGVAHTPHEAAGARLHARERFFTLQLGREGGNAGRTPMSVWLIPKLWPRRVGMLAQVVAKGGMTH
jgi:hypothetical protein